MVYPLLHLTAQEWSSLDLSAGTIRVSGLLHESDPSDMAVIEIDFIDLFSIPTLELPLNEGATALSQSLFLWRSPKSEVYAVGVRVMDLRSREGASRRD